MLTQETKQKINTMIFERAYEIEERLSADDFYLAKLAGVSPSKVSDVALECAIKELKKTIA